jgi:hypothetical protein
LWLKSESISRNKATLHVAWRKEKFRIVFYWRPHLPSWLSALPSGIGNCSWFTFCPGNCERHEWTVSE